MKVVYNTDILRELRDIFQFRRVLGKDWIKSTNKYISLSTNRGHIKDLIALMKDNKENKWMKVYVTTKRFLSHIIGLWIKT